jgi:hypothetical protein
MRTQLKALVNSHACSVVACLWYEGLEYVRSVWLFMGWGRVCHNGCPAAVDNDCSLWFFAYSEYET